MDERLQTLATRAGRNLNLIGNMARKRASQNPQETRWTVGGFFAGIGLYTVVGGIGLALMGTAISLFCWMTLPVASLFIGRRLGMKRDKRKPLLLPKAAAVDQS